jgi:hypothetical protein
MCILQMCKYADEKKRLREQVAIYEPTHHFLQGYYYVTPICTSEI